MTGGVDATFVAQGHVLASGAGTVLGRQPHGGRGRRRHFQRPGDERPGGELPMPEAMREPSSEFADAPAPFDRLAVPSPPRRACVSPIDPEFRPRSRPHLRSPPRPLKSPASTLPPLGRPSPRDRAWPASAASRRIGAHAGLALVASANQPVRGGDEPRRQRAERSKRHSEPSLGATAVTPRTLFRWDTPAALGMALAALLALRTIADIGLPQRVESLSLDARFRLRPVSATRAPS